MASEETVTMVAMAVVTAVIITIISSSNTRLPQKRHPDRELLQARAMRQLITVRNMLSITDPTHTPHTVATKTMSPITNTISSTPSSNRNSNSNNPRVLLHSRLHHLVKLLHRLRRLVLALLLHLLLVVAATAL